MSTCASCGAELAPSWKFCIKCGAPVAVSTLVAEPVAEFTLVAEPVETIAEEHEVIAEAEPEPETEAEVIPAAIRPDVEPRRFNILAILALLLACIGGAPALIFGHVAIGQIKESGERGLRIAQVATVLGYVWLVVWVVLITVLVTGVWR